MENMGFFSAVVTMNMLSRTPLPLLPRPKHFIYIRGYFWIISNLAKTNFDLAFLFQRRLYIALFINLSTNDNIFAEQNKKNKTEHIMYFVRKKHQQHKISFIHLIINVTR